MEQRELLMVQNLIDYNFQNKDLLQQAFIRKSYAMENGGSDNEVLEFIGDRVLDMIVVQLLTDEYGYFAEECDDFLPAEEYNEFFSDLDEGEMTEVKKKLVQRKYLAHRIDMLGFADYLIMGKSDIKNKVNYQEAVKEDLFEAIIGAVTLDCKWNMKILKNVIEIMLAPDDELNDNSSENYIGLVQEWSMKKEGMLPLYHVESCKQGYKQIYLCRGRTDIHNRPMPISTPWKYMSYFKFQSIDRVFLDFGMSEKEARMNVAEYAYRFLEKNDMLFSIKDEIDNPSKEYSINQLEILARRGYFSVPTYEFHQKYDENGSPIWKCSCYVKKYSKKFSAEASAKKAAKKAAAYKMLMYVLEYGEG